MTKNRYMKTTILALSALIGWSGINVQGQNSSGTASSTPGAAQAQGNTGSSSQSSISSQSGAGQTDSAARAGVFPDNSTGAGAQTTLGTGQGTGVSGTTVQRTP